LALAARAQTYGEKIPYSGPIYNLIRLKEIKFVSSLIILMVV
jgi:hypothetical protein